jgi:hypothetical protein
MRAQPRHEARSAPELTAKAIRQLLDIARDQLGADDATWLRGVLGWLRQGEPLSLAEVSRISAIRARLARLYHFTEWQGANGR